MVTMYSLICKLVNSPDLPKYVKAGLISYTLIDYKLIYEYYCNEKARGVRNSEAILYTAEEFNKSENMIYKIKTRLESEIK